MLNREQIEELHNVLQMAWCEYTRNCRYAQRSDSLIQLTQLRDMALAHLQSQPAGYVSVPREPTREMYEACDAVIGPKWPHTTYECAQEIYRAMLAASPPAGEGARVPRRLGAHGYGEGDA